MCSNDVVLIFTSKRDFPITGESIQELIDSERADREGKFSTEIGRKIGNESGEE